MEITKENCHALENLIRTQFLDLHKIIEMFDQKQAGEFKRINAAFMEVALKEEGRDHKGHMHDGTHAGCSHSAVRRYYMPEDRMSTVDRIMDGMLFKNNFFFTVEDYKNLRAILEDINRAFTHF
jgi:hypothetical protein